MNVVIKIRLIKKAKKIMVEERKNLSVGIEEQETHISYMRDESFAKVYTSDSTQMTRLDKLCKINPHASKLIENTCRWKSYLISDKWFISFMAKKREMTEEQKRIAAERMRKLHDNGSMSRNK